MKDYVKCLYRKIYKNRIRLYGTVNREECIEMLQDALREMIIAYNQQGKEIPLGDSLLEQIPVEI